MLKHLVIAIIATCVAVPAEAKPGYQLHEDGSYSCSTDTSCMKAGRAQAKYYRQQGWECLTDFDWRGCLGLF